MYQGTDAACVCAGAGVVALVGTAPKTPE